MSFANETKSVSKQVDIILKNRLRRFKYLVRSNRLDDALCIADEFFEWIDPKGMTAEDFISYYCADELEDMDDQYPVKNL